MLISLFNFSFLIFHQNYYPSGNFETILCLSNDLVYSEEFDGSLYSWSLEGVSDPYLYAYSSEFTDYIIEDQNFIKNFWHYSEEYYNIPPHIVDHASIHYENGFWWISDTFMDTIRKCYDNWTHTGESYSVGAQETFPKSIFYHDGFWWVTGQSSYAVHKYFNNWTFTGESNSVSAEGSPSDIYYKNSNWWMLSESNKRVYMYYDNWSYTGINYYLGSQDKWPRSLDYWDGFWWILGESSDRIYKYFNNWTFTGEMFSIFGLDYFTNDIHIIDGVLWYMGSYTDSVYKFNYEDLYQIPKINVKEDYIFVQTDSSELLILSSPNTLDLTLQVNSRIEITFNTSSTNRIDLYLLNDASYLSSFLLSPQGNNNFNTRTIEFTIEEEISFDQLRFIGDFMPSHNLKVDQIKIYKPIVDNTPTDITLIVGIATISTIAAVIGIPSGYYLYRKKKYIAIPKSAEKYKPRRERIVEGIYKFTAVSIIGSLLSILIALFMPVLYPEFYFFGELFVQAFQTIVFIGGALSITGTIITYNNMKLGKILVLIGGILGGGNIIILYSLKYLRD